jgi:hypothetical protein
MIQKSQQKVLLRSVQAAVLSYGRLALLVEAALFSAPGEAGAGPEICTYPGSVT